MTFREIELLLIIGIALTLLVRNRLSPDLIALLTLLALGISGLVKPAQALSGFSNPAVITIVGLFVISAALERTGAIEWLAEWLASIGGASERRLVALFLVVGALLSLVMNNIAAGALLLPAVLSVARRSEVYASRLLIPLSFGTLLGGMATLFTTANIILSGTLQVQGYRVLTMADFLPSGGLVTLLGLVYMLTIGLRLLPFHPSVGSTILTGADLSNTYQLAERLWEVRVLPGSRLAGRTLAETGFGEYLGVTVLAIWRQRAALIPPAPTDVIDVGDFLLVLGREERVNRLEEYGVGIGRNTNHQLERNNVAVLLTEVIVGPRNPAIGRTLKELRFRSRYGMTTVALWRAGRSYRTDVGDFALQAGDALLMVGAPAQVRKLAEEPGFIVMDQPNRALPRAARKAGWAFLITVAVLLVSILGWVPTAEAVLAGIVALVLAGCLTMSDVYRAIEWRVVVMIAGLLPIGIALVDTGLAAKIGLLFTQMVSPYGALALVAGLYLFTMLLTQLIGGQVTALVVGPIAVSAAAQTGLNPIAVGVAVSMACSAAFLSPIAHPVNLLMMGPGGYSFGDFSRVGAGLALVCFLGTLAAMVLFWGM